MTTKTDHRGLEELSKITGYVTIAILVVLPICWGAAAVLLSARLALLGGVLLITLAVTLALGAEARKQHEAQGHTRKDTHHD